MDPEYDVFEEVDQEDPDEEVLQLDYDITKEEVIERIESCALWLIDQIASGCLPDLALSPTDTASSSTTTVLSLAGRHAESADRYARLWSILHLSHQNLIYGTTSTQREIHYRHKKATSRELFRSHSHLQDAIQDAVSLLKVPRALLGISCSGKGLLGGNIVISSSSSSSTTSGAMDIVFDGRQQSHMLIPGDLSTIESYNYDILDAQYILVVEKDTVFQRLVASSSTNKMIFVTGKGVPDLASRALLASLHTAHPHLPILGLVDWNPSGVVILSIYKYGSKKMMESTRYMLPTLQWLGARSPMLREYLPTGDSFQDLTVRDRSLIPSLRSVLSGRGECAWVAELEVMQESGSKMDLEGLYDACEEDDGFARLVQHAVETRDWV